MGIQEEDQLEEQTSHGRVICVVISIVYLVLFAVCGIPQSQPMGEMARGIAILYATPLVFIASIIAITFLYRNECRNRLHFVPLGLFVLWIALFAPLFIDKPYYWGIVSIQNRSAADIWVENIGLVEGGNKKWHIGSGVDWGNSSDSITVVWWYGSSNVPPFDKTQINRMVLRPPANLPRRTSLDVTIHENGQWSIDSYPASEKSNDERGDERGTAKNFPRD